MARTGRDTPERSILAHLQGLEFPIDRDELVDAAADDGAPTEVINFLKCLPAVRYASLDDVQRDFAEAAKRFGLGADRPAWFEHGDRSNIGHDAMDVADVKHP